MDPHSDDFARFGIDTRDADASLRLQRVRFLTSRGVPDEEIRADSSLETLSRRAWARIFLGTDELVPLRDVAQREGFDAAEAVRVSQLLGHPTTEDTLVVPSDAAILNELDSFAQLFGREQADQLLRLIGTSLARLAEALAATARVTYETPILQTGTYFDYLEGVEVIVETYFPRLAAMMDRVLRYHLMGMTTDASWGVDAELTVMTVDRTVGFADMIGFTTTTGRQSARELAAMVEAFEARVSQTITAHGGRAVKFIGDEVFFSFVDASSACGCALELLKLAADEMIPDVRVGMASGEMIGRFGDYYGPVVNVAKRIVDIADQGTALVTRDLADRAKDHTFEALAPRQIKGVESAVEILRLSGRP